MDAYLASITQARVHSRSRPHLSLIDAQHTEHERLKKKGKVVPWVFFRLVANGRGGPLRPKPITSFIKAFKTACRKAGCPGRIPHDLRRTLSGTSNARVSLAQWR